MLPIQEKQPRLYDEQQVRSIIRENTEDDSNLDSYLSETGIEDPGLWEIAGERLKQIASRGYSIEKDIQENNTHQLRQVAVGLLLVDQPDFNTSEWVEKYCPENWDKAKFTKLLQTPYIDRLRIAGALCAAEISRLRVYDDHTGPSIS